MKKKIAFILWQQIQPSGQKVLGCVINCTKYCWDYERNLKTYKFYGHPYMAHSFHKILDCVPWWCTFSQNDAWKFCRCAIFSRSCIIYAKLRKIKFWYKFISYATSATRLLSDVKLMGTGQFPLSNPSLDSVEKLNFSGGGGGARGLSLTRNWYMRPSPIIVSRFQLFLYIIRKMLHHIK